MHNNVGGVSHLSASFFPSPGLKFPTKTSSPGRRGTLLALLSHSFLAEDAAVAAYF